VPPPLEQALVDMHLPVKPLSLVQVVASAAALLLGDFEGVPPPIVVGGEAVLLLAGGPAFEDGLASPLTKGPKPKHVSASGTSLV
jgi:hypothetical protein